jgi:hypothetical protein
MMKTNNESSDKIDVWELDYELQGKEKSIKD